MIRHIATFWSRLFIFIRWHHDLFENFLCMVYGVGFCALVKNKWNGRLKLTFTLKQSANWIFLCSTKSDRISIYWVNQFRRNLKVKNYGLLLIVPLLVPVMVFLLLTELVVVVLLEVSVWVQGQAACWQSSASQSSPTQLELDGQARALLRPAWSPPHIGMQLLQELQGSQEPDMSTGTWPLAMLTDVWRLSSTLWTIGWSWWLREARASWNLTCFRLDCFPRTRRVPQRLRNVLIYKVQERLRVANQFRN